VSDDVQGMDDHANSPTGAKQPIDLDADAKEDEQGVVGLDLTKYTVLLSKVSGGKRLTLYTDKKRLHAYFWIQPTSPYFEITFEEVEGALEPTGLQVPNETLSQLNTLIAELLKAQQSGEMNPDAFKPIEIARGVPPKAGEDGFFEWYITEPDPSKLRFEPDESGRVDYREQNKVINVDEEQPLVTIHPPTQGAPGRDVFGNTLPAQDGAVKRLAAGTGVLLEEKTQTMYAETSGHVVNANSVINVSPVYIVPGDVDFHVGNINFRGAVLVKGDVTEGFTIRASDNILCQGTVSQANLIAGGDIEIQGGLSSTGGKGIIEAKGRVIAKHMVNAIIDGQGDILVEKQVVNCELSCAGRLYIPKGKLLGGVTTALGGIEADEIGAELGTRTTLIVSLDHFTTSDTRAIDAEIKTCETKLSKIEGLLGPYLTDRSMLNQLPQAKMEAVLAQIKELDDIQDRLAELEDERAQALEPFADVVSDEIIVYKRLHPGVDVRIDNSRQVFAETIDGPIRLKPNYSRGTIAILPL